MALLLFCSLMMAVGVLTPASAHHAADCSDVLTPLSNFVTTGVNNNKSFYERVMNETGVPWELLAAIHYRETSFSHTNPGNGQGIFQFVNGDGGPYPPGAVSDEEFVRQLRFMATKLQDDYVWRGKIPRERRKLQPNEQNIAIVKDTLFSYNGRAGAYIDQASHFGYNPSLQPYEGSPYVMNRFDCPRARMGIITRDYNTGIDGTDTRYGAFTIFARLRGDPYWKSLWNSAYGGLGDSFVLAKSDNEQDLRQWVIYGNLKQHIPSPEVLTAWGLQNRTPATLNWEALSAFADGPQLDILMRVNNGNDVYLVDGGKRFRIQSPNMMEAWKLGGKVISNVSGGLASILAEGGSLTYSVKKEGSSALYMVDGLNGSGNVVLRQYEGPNVYGAWEGDNAPSVTISANLFDTMDNAIGSSLNNSKITYEGNEYQVVSGQRLYLGTGVAPLYPGVAQAVTAHTFNRLVPSQETSQFLRSAGDSIVYLVDKGQKHPVGEPAMVRAWAKGVDPPVNIVSGGYATLIPTSDAITTYLGESGNGQLYIMDGRKIPVEANLDAAYRTNTVYRASNALLALQVTAENAKPLLKTFDVPHIYVMENGNRRYIGDPTDFNLWSGGSNQFTAVSYYVTDAFAMGQSATAYVSDGVGNNYVVDGNNKRPVSTGAAANWGFSSPTSVASSTLARLNTATALGTDKAKVGNVYYLVQSGRTFATTDLNLANAWELGDAPVVPEGLLHKTHQEVLKRFVASTDGNDKRIFTADSGHLYHITTPAMVLALGYDGNGMTKLSPGAVATMANGTVLSTPIVKNNSNQFFVIDNGTKRSFTSDVTRDQWTNNGSISAITFSDSWLNMFGFSPSLSKSIKGGGPAVYRVSAGLKQWLLSQASYSPAYAPYTQTTDLLLDTLPSGEHIP